MRDLDTMSEQELRDFEAVCDQALGDAQSLEQLRSEVSAYVGFEIPASQAVKYAHEVRTMIQTRLRLGVATNDNYRSLS